MSGYNLRDKNDRAIAAYLKPVVQSVSPSIEIYICNDNRDRDIVDGPGLIDVDTKDGPENPIGTGNYDFNVMVRAKIPGTQQPNEKVDANKKMLAALLTAVHGALHLGIGQDYQATCDLITQTANALAIDASNGQCAEEAAFAQVNADMADYSMLALTHINMIGGAGNKEAQDLNFYELANFKVNVTGIGGMR